MIGALAAAVFAVGCAPALSAGRAATAGQKADATPAAAAAATAPATGGGNATGGGSTTGNGKSGSTPAAGGGGGTAAGGGGAKTGGGGGGTTAAGGGTKPTKPTPTKKPTTKPTQPPGGAGGAGGKGTASPTPSATPTNGSGTPTAGTTTKKKPSKTTTTVAGAEQSPTSGGGSSGSAQRGTGAGTSADTGADDPATSSKRTKKVAPEPPDPITKIVTKIVEVIPLWAKILMGVLGALVVLLAVGSHLRLRQRAGEYHHQALHDALTELPNRTYFVESVAEALEDAEEDGSRIAVMLIDLDGFKEVNDTLGHTSGDRLLEQVAARLVRAVRDGDTVARLGGDEFAVLLPGVPDATTAASIGAKLLTALRGTYTVDDLSVHSDASIGIALGPDHGDDADTLLRHADVAMYVAKAQRAGVSVYDVRRDGNSPERLAMIADLRRGISRREFGLFFQPQIEPHTGRVDGVEALVRWRHPTRGLIPPDDFVALAERTGVIRPLSLFVLETAIRECAGWLGAGVDMRVAVNLSAASLVDTELPATVDRLLKEWQVPANFLRLEITETTAMADPARTQAVLARLDALGVDLSIDDFGTGYSSLAYLRSLPVREIKIDRSFVMRMATDPNDHAIVVATIDLGHDLGLRVVAEGVEDEATLRELDKKGCDLVQGFLFAKPMPAEELRIWLQGWPGTRFIRRGATPPVAAPEALPHSV